MGNGWSIRVSFSFKKASFGLIVTLFSDILMEVISLSHFHHDSGQLSSPLKRPRNATSIDVSSEGEEPIGQRRTAGSGRVRAVWAALEREIGPPRDSEPLDPPASNLPLHSSDLGSLPVHENFEWATAQNQPWIDSDSWLPSHTYTPLENAPDWQPLFDQSSPAFGESLETPLGLSGSSTPGEFDVAQVVDVQNSR